MAKEKQVIARPYTNDYGLTKGHCVTPRGALNSAKNYLIANNRRHCVIERPDGRPVDVWYDGYWGLHSQVRSNSNVVPLKLKRRA